MCPEFDMPAYILANFAMGLVVGLLIAFCLWASNDKEVD